VLQHTSTASALMRPGLVAAIGAEVLLQTLAITPEQHRRTVHERPLEGFASSSAFDPRDDRLAPTREVYERSVLGELLWPTARARPTFEQCCAAVREFPGGL
jgi:hypothetical protein